MPMPQNQRYHQGSPHTQGGIALVVSLVVLLIMTLVGVSAMRSSILEERMAGALQDQNRAFQAAEAALRDAERYLQNAKLDTFNNENGLYQFNADEMPIWFGADQRPGTGGYLVYSVNRPGTGAQSTAIPDVVAQPQYFIEKYKDIFLAGESLELGELPGSEQYRVTARGFGANADTIAVLRSTYRR